MSDGYERFNNQGNGDSGGSFVVGLLTGAVLGAGLGLLFAPKAGAELRRQLGEKVDDLANTASETYRRASESAGDWVGKAQESAGDWAEKASAAAEDLAERGKEIYGKAREAVAKGADEAQRYVQDARVGTDAPSPSTSGTGSGTSSFGSGPAGSHSTGPRRT